MAKKSAKPRNTKARPPAAAPPKPDEPQGNPAEWGDPVCSCEAEPYWVAAVDGSEEEWGDAGRE